MENEDYLEQAHRINRYNIERRNNILIKSDPSFRDKKRFQRLRYVCRIMKGNGHAEIPWGNHECITILFTACHFLQYCQLYCFTVGTYLDNTITIGKFFSARSQFMIRCFQQNLWIKKCRTTNRKRTSITLEIFLQRRCQSDSKTNFYVRCLKLAREVESNATSL